MPPSGPELNCGPGPLVLSTSWRHALVVRPRDRVARLDCRCRRGRTGCSSWRPRRRRLRRRRRAAAAALSAGCSVFAAAAAAAAVVVVVVTAAGRHEAERRRRRGAIRATSSWDGTTNRARLRANAPTAARAAPSARAGGSRPGPRRPSARRRALSSLISSPGWAGQAVEHDRVVARLRHQAGVDAVRARAASGDAPRPPRRPCSPRRRCRSRARRRRPRRGRRRARSGSESSGGVATATSTPAIAPPIRSERVMLLPSPTYASFSPSSVPKRSSSVIRSASTWQGWCSWVSMLITGTSDQRASSSTVSCGPVRIADRVHHPLEHERGVARRTRRARAAARPREGSADDRRARTHRSRTRRACASTACRRRAPRCVPRARASRAGPPSARSRARSRRSCSSALSSSPVRKCLAMRVLSWNLYHGRDFPPDPALFTLARPAAAEDRAKRDPRPGQPAAPRRVRGRARRARVGRRPPPGGAAALVPRRCARAPARTARSCRTSRNWCPPLQRRLADWNPDLLASFDGGSNQMLVRAPGTGARAAPPDARPPARAAAHALGAARASRGQACARRTCTPPRACPSVPRPRWCGRPSTRSPGRTATRSSSAATSTCARRATRSPSRSSASACSSPRRPPRDAIDHLLVRGLEVVERPRRLAPERRELTEPDGLRIRLSDHAPVSGAFALSR